MNSEEAKDILQLCRPDHLEDLNDPLIAEALEHLSEDADLSVWFEDQKRFDQEVCEEFSRITPPPELKQTILEGMQQRVEATVESSSILRFRPWMGIAATLLFASTFLMVLARREPLPQSSTAETGGNYGSARLYSDPFISTAGIPDIIQFLGRKLENTGNLNFNKRSERINELQSYLAVSGMPNPVEIPGTLKTSPTIGCMSFNYKGIQLSMICFRSEQVCHLITVNRSDLGANQLPDIPPSKAEFFEHENQIFKLWARGNQIYILCTKAKTKQNIPEFI